MRLFEHVVDFHVGLWVVVGRLFVFLKALLVYAAFGLGVEVLVGELRGHGLGLQEVLHLPPLVLQKELFVLYGFFEHALVEFSGLALVWPLEAHVVKHRMHRLVRNCLFQLLRWFYPVGRGGLLRLNDWLCECQLLLGAVLVLDLTVARVGGTLFEEHLKGVMVAFCLGD